MLWMGSEEEERDCGLTIVFLVSVIVFAWVEVHVATGADDVYSSRRMKRHMSDLLRRLTECQLLHAPARLVRDIRMHLKLS